MAEFFNCRQNVPEGRDSWQLKYTTPSLLVFSATERIRQSIISSMLQKSKQRHGQASPLLSTSNSRARILAAPFLTAGGATSYPAPLNTGPLHVAKAIACWLYITEHHMSLAGWLGLNTQQLTKASGRSALTCAPSTAYHLFSHPGWTILAQNDWHVFTLDKDVRHPERNGRDASALSMSAPRTGGTAAGRHILTACEPFLFISAIPGPSVFYRLAVWHDPEALGKCLI